MRRLWAFVIASLILHFLFGSGLRYLPAGPSLPSASKPIDVTLLSDKPDDQKPKSKKQNQLDRAVLDADVPKDLQIESQEEASLLSQRRQRVKKQSVARDFGMTRNSPHPNTVDKPQAGAGNSGDQKNTENGNSQKSTNSKMTSERVEKLRGDKKKFGGLVLEPNPFGDIPIPSSRKGEGGRDPRHRDRAQNDAASEELTQRLQSLSIGGGRTAINEHIPGVQAAEITALNTNPYLYYSFYSRMVSQLRFHWENNLASVIPSLEMTAAQRFPNREEWITQISMYLDTKGHVLKVDVDKSCGLTDLDYAVVRALHSGGPYRNPPTEMAEDGEIRIQLNFDLNWRPNLIVNRRDDNHGAEF